MTQFTGLSEREAALSREKYGSNAIPESEPTTFWAEFKATFQDPMIRILLAVALLMVVMCLFGYADVYEPAGTILAVILVAIVSAKTGVASDTKYRQLKGSAKRTGARCTGTASSPFWTWTRWWWGTRCCSRPGIKFPPTAC